MFGLQQRNWLNSVLQIKFFKEDKLLKMYTGGKKIKKPEKTKFRKNTDNENVKQSKNQKRHDRSTYRLLKEEKEYVI